MNTLDFLRTHEYASVDSFISKAQYLKDNWPWLKYSYAIAIRVRSRMRELGITQKELARQLGCTQQHVSVLLGGKSNMTLETVSKLEQALSFDLIGQSLNEFNHAAPEGQAMGYLNDSAVAGDAPDGFETGRFVDGYKLRKKKGPKK